jgi:uncharacterized protein YbaR (Trm112 family)
MLCPNCNNDLEELKLDNQNVLHCSSCKSSFFEENGINRITASTAKKLADGKKDFFVSGNTKVCPKDKSPLSPIKDDELIPANVTLLRCNQCRGIFAYPDDLMNFKKAQEVKIDFFKTWSKPLSSLRSVLVMVFVAVFFISIIVRNNVQKVQVSQSRADELITNLNIFININHFSITFKTPVPLRSELSIEDKTTGQTIRKIISDKQTTVHYAVITGTKINAETYYKIILYDNEGGRFETKEKKLSP